MLVTSDGKVQTPPFNINDIQYPPNIEQLYSDAELNAIGLYRVKDDGPPPNVLVTDVSAEKQQDGTWLAVYTTQPKPVVVPATISMLQFYQEMAVSGKITTDQALAAMNGTLPPDIATLVGKMAASDQFAAKMKLAGSNPSIARSDALISSIASAYNMQTADMDQVFIKGALL